MNGFKADTEIMNAVYREMKDISRSIDGYAYQIGQVAAALKAESPMQDLVYEIMDLSEQLYCYGSMQRRLADALDEINTMLIQCDKFVAESDDLV